MNKFATIVLAACVGLLTVTAVRADVTLNSVRLGAKNVESVAQFYVVAFGLQEVNRLPTANGPEIFLNFGDTVDAAKANPGRPIVLMPRATDSPDDPIAHLILNVTDMTAAASDVRSAGGSMAGEPRPFGNTGIVIGIAVDPAGNRIELIQRP
jgi:predicted enzyme related to lactoylglutathione lyase